MFSVVGDYPFVLLTDKLFEAFGEILGHSVTETEAQARRRSFGTMSVGSVLMPSEMLLLLVLMSKRKHRAGQTSNP